MQLLLLIAFFIFNPVHANNNGDFLSRSPVLTKFEIAEISNEIGKVSTKTKQFRLTVEHNGDFLEPVIADANFDSGKSILLSNLEIIKRDLNRKGKERKSVRHEYKFTPEADSENLGGKIYRTTYISNEQIIKKAQRLKFRVDFFTYLRTKTDFDVKTLTTKYVSKVDIEALVFDFTDLDIDSDSISFSVKKPDAKKSKITSGTLNISGKFDYESNVSNIVKRLQFKSENDKGKKQGIRFKKEGPSTNEEKLKLKVKPEANLDSFSIVSNGGTHTINIPVSFTSKKKVKKARRDLLGNLDLAIIPVSLDIKTGNGLDLNVSGIITKELEVIINETSTEE